MVQFLIFLILRNLLTGVIKGEIKMCFFGVICKYKKMYERVKSDRDFFMSLYLDRISKIKKEESK